MYMYNRNITTSTYYQNILALMYMYNRNITTSTYYQSILALMYMYNVVFSI
jgi:hypothetical protein